MAFGFEEDLANIMEDGMELTKKVFYKFYKNGTSKEINAIFDLQKNNIDYNEGRNLADTQICYIKQDEIDFVTIYDEIIDGYEVWKVRKFEKRGGLYLLELSKDDIPSGSHTGHRFR